jgi:inhibitor of cysteine peptidase
MCIWSLTRVTALLGAWLMYSSSAGFAAEAGKAPSAMVFLTETDSGRTVDVRLGDTVQVALRENATTGYRWAIDRYDEEFIEAVGSESHYAPDTKNSIGVGGTVAFIFRGKKAGTGEVVLKNWRHWEGDKSITSRFRFHLHIEP